MLETLQSFGPATSGALLLGLGAALFSAWWLWRIGASEERQLRLNAIVGAAGHRVGGPLPRGSRLQRLMARLAEAPLIGSGARAKLVAALTLAGIRGENGMAVLMAAKFAGILLGGLLVRGMFDWSQLLEGHALVRLGVVAVGCCGGWMVPDIVLDRLAAGRRIRIEQALPDALDLLVICAEAGLSLSQSIEEIGRDLQHLSPEISQEFETTAAEMRMLSDRGAALQNLARRCGLDSLRGLIATLNQSIKFGTPLAESVRQFAAEMRIERMAQLEERAAKLPVLLALPLIGLIMPALLMVIGTPVAIRIIDQVFAAFPGFH
jgi:tight adherence protein C